MPKLSLCLPPPVRPTHDRPLLGQTVLLVEDSHTSAESLRLLCTRSGARLRRANSLAAAHKHLQVYVPSILLVDLTLPDGTGLDLISEMTGTGRRIGTVLAISADERMLEQTINAGADGFITKPIMSLQAFNAQIIRHVGLRFHPTIVAGTDLQTDQVAMAQDIRRAVALLKSAQIGPGLSYVTSFVQSFAKEIQDPALAAAAQSLASHGIGLGHRNKLARLLDDKLMHGKEALNV
jgi:CheY-like chemotaxis protein